MRKGWILKEYQSDCGYIDVKDDGLSEDRGSVEGTSHVLSRPGPIDQSFKFMMMMF